jgi:hypothetical protein
VFSEKPYNDIEKIREVHWNELGIFWTVRWENGYLETALCEQFLATLQIMLADLGEVDLLLLKTSIEISILIDDIPETIIKSKNTNYGREWLIVLPAAVNSEKYPENYCETKFLEAAIEILFDVSLLTQKKFFERIEQSIKNGLKTKIFVGQSYAKMHQLFIDKEHFNEIYSLQTEIPKLSHNFKIKDNPYLPWHNNLYPNYSDQKTKMFLRNRYSRLIPPIRSILKQLSQNQQFQQSIANLRKEGWLDWHILAAIHGITLNYRASQKITPEMDEKTLNRVYKESEKDSEIEIPVSEFSEQRMRECQRGNMLASLKTFELECHQRTPDFQGIEHFLRYRCNYWKDDIEHKDPFV